MSAFGGKADIGQSAEIVALTHNRDRRTRIAVSHNEQFPRRRVVK